MRCLADDCPGDGVCNDVGGEEGECNQGTVRYCDLSLRANGVPFISCNNNNDCGVYPGFDLGTCTATTPRPCFLPTIVAEGALDPDYPVAQPARFGVAAELTHRRAEEVVRLPVLVDQPERLVRMLHRPGRVLGANDQIHRASIERAEVEKSPG